MLLHFAQSVSRRQHVACRQSQVTSPPAARNARSGALQDSPCHDSTDGSATARTILPHVTHNSTIPLAWASYDVRRPTIPPMPCYVASVRDAGHSSVAERRRREFGARSAKTMTVRPPPGDQHTPSGGGGNDKPTPNQGAGSTRHRRSVARDAEPCIRRWWGPFRTYECRTDPPECRSAPKGGPLPALWTDHGRRGRRGPRQKCGVSRGTSACRRHGGASGRYWWTLVELVHIDGFSPLSRVTMSGTLV